MKSKFKRLGDYIRLVDVRKRDGSIGSDRLLGININKEFIPSVANVSETDLTRYKVISKGIFACNVMHRETFDCSDMCNVRLPIPAHEIQECIVAIHHTLETRKRLNTELKSKIQNLCPILMRGVAEKMISANL